MKRRLQETDAVDHEDLGGDDDLTVLGEGKPRTGGESLGPGATNRHQPLARGRATVEKSNLEGKEDRAREEAQHQGGQATSRIHGRQPRRRDLRGLSATVARGQRVVGQPYGHRHVMHARCVVYAVRKSGAQAPSSAALEVAQPAVRDGKHYTTVGLGGYPTMARIGGFVGSATP